MNHIALRVDETERSTRFFTEIFGYDVLERIDDELGRFTLVILGRAGYGSVELIRNWDEGTVMPGRTLAHYGFSVHDLRACERAAEASGFRILERSVLANGRKQVYVEGPAGVPVEINEIRESS